MITVKIKKFPVIAGLVHESTTWLMAKDRNFKDLLVEQKNSLSKELFYSDILVPPNVRYYVKGIRHFSGTKSVLETNVIPIVGNKDTDSFTLLLEDVYFEKPTINIEIVKNEDSSYYKIDLSSPRTSIEIHDYTSWIITDSLGEVIYKSMKDYINKKSILIELVNEIKSKTSLTIYAIQGSNLGIESPIAKFVYKLSNSDFEIVTNLDKLEYDNDNYIEFKGNVKSIRKVNIMDSINDISLLEYNLLKTDKFLIPWNISKTDKALDLKITYTNIFNAEETLTKKLNFTTRNKIIDPVKRNPYYIYNFNITDNENSTLELVDEDIKFIIEEIPINKHFPMYVNKTNSGDDIINGFKLYKNINNKLVDADLNTFSSLSDVNPRNTKYHSFLVKPLSSNIFIVDREINSVPTFSIIQLEKKYDGLYHYNNIINIERDTETRSLGINGSLTYINSGRLLYLSNNEYCIKELDLINFSTKKITDIYDYENKKIIKPENVSMFRLLETNELLIINADDGRSIIYNFEKNIFKEGIITLPESMVGSIPRIIKLVNGDVLIAREFPNTDNEVNMVYYSQSERKIHIFNNDIFYETKIYPTGFIMCENGKVFMQKGSDKTYIFI